METRAPTREGSEQDTVIEWAKAGRITSDCQIRNALMKKWTPADKVNFLLAYLTLISLISGVQFRPKKTPAYGSRHGVVCRHHPTQYRCPLKDFFAVGFFENSAGLVTVGHDG